jgi:hypothetical protein
MVEQPVANSSALPAVSDNVRDLSGMVADANCAGDSDDSVLRVSCHRREMLGVVNSSEILPFPVAELSP